MTTRIDAHHHIWRVDQMPWLSGPVVPRIFGDYAPLQRDYLLDEFMADAQPSGVTAAVFVQANVAAGLEVDEAAWVAREGRGFIQAVVGFADLESPAVADILDRQAAVAPLRGIRQQLHWHPRPDYRFAPDPLVMQRPAFRRGLGELQRRGLHFELQIFPGQFPAAIELVGEFESLLFVLVHSGMPEDLGVDGRAAWSQGLRRFAQKPNVVTKVSGLGTFARRVVAADWQYVVRVAVDAFGPDRSMFGSNFPIEKLWTDYSTLVGTLDDCLAIYSARERNQVWCETARRIYQLGSATVGSEKDPQQEER